jgi:hypothetical protein
MPLFETLIGIAIGAMAASAASQERSGSSDDSSSSERYYLDDREHTFHDDYMNDTRHRRNGRS